MPIFLGLRPQLGRNLLIRSNSAPSVSSFQITACLADQIDVADIVGLGADRQRQHHRHSAEPLADHPDAAEEVGADPVHLVDEAEPRHAVLVGLAPHRLRLRLDAGDRIEHRDRAVQHPQRALDLDREIDVAGGVDDVDAMVLPGSGGRGRGDRDAALLLLLHPVHGGGALVHLAELVRSCQCNIACARSSWSCRHRCGP